MIGLGTLVIRNLGRNRTRSTLTGASMALAMALVCLLRTLPTAFDLILTHYTQDTRLSVHNKAGLVYGLPYSYLEKVRRVPGVVEATSWTWFGGVFEDEKSVSFPSFAVDHATMDVVYPDLPVDPQAFADFRRFRDAALVGRKTLRTYGWQVGDLVTLRSTMYPVALELRIVGAVEDERDQRLWFQREYLVQALEAQSVRDDLVGIIWTRVGDAEKVAETIGAIDEMFRNSEAETATETEKAFFQAVLGDLRDLLRVVLVATALVALCVLGIAANTASMVARERATEIAVMKALGFRARTLVALLVLEATLLSTLAGAGGLALATALASALRRGANWSVQLAPLAGFVVGRQVVAECMLLALAVGVVSSVAPALGAARRSVTATLRATR